MSRKNFLSSYSKACCWLQAEVGASLYHLRYLKLWNQKVMIKNASRELSDRCLSYPSWFLVSLLSQEWSGPMRLSNSHPSLFKCNLITELSVFSELPFVYQLSCTSSCTLAIPGTPGCKPGTRSECFSLSCLGWEHLADVKGGCWCCVCALYYAYHICMCLKIQAGPSCSELTKLR